MSIYQLVKNDLTDPDLVFHYTKLDVGLQAILGQNKLKFGLLGNSNDPFEYQSAYHSISSGVIRNRSMTEEDWNTVGAPNGWSIRNRLNQLRKERTHFLSTCSSHSRGGLSYSQGS